MDSSERQAVRVTIFSRPYTVRSSGDRREVETLAAECDELMHTIAERFPTADATHIAVLACLHFADRARELNRTMEELKESLGSRTQRFAGMLEQLIATVEEDQ
jgi:cell division protein ZapA (FtsZ GTPase activity inhibitor)